MTDTNWVTAKDPTPLLEFLGDRLSGRMRALFGLACYRRVVHLVTQTLVLGAFRTGERLHDGTADVAALAPVGTELGEAADGA